MSVFTVNHNSDGDVVHQEHGWEACNLDDAEDLETVDENTARNLVGKGQGRECEHCRPFGASA